MNCEIITIGDELLIGQVIDTNSAWMATEFNKVGIDVVQITSISDREEHLVEALDDAAKRADIVIMTGGLGPTKDDRTKKVLANYFDSPLVLHEPTLVHVTTFFEKRGLPVNQLNKDQALVPDCCRVLPNPVGTAPGMWFKKGNVIYASLPGVPFEMKRLIKEQVIPRLIQKNALESIYHKTVLTTGIPESILAEKLEPWEDNLPENVKLAYLPSPLMVRLRLSVKGGEQWKNQELIDGEIEKLKAYIPDAIFGYDNETMAGNIGRMLVKAGKTLATAESCTGGNVARLITSMPGSSEWFQGSVVAYSNEIKNKILRVSSKDLEKFGAVSESVVEQMAQNICQLFDTDYAIAISGIAGPDGGTDEKPVGTTWIAVAGPKGVKAQLFCFAHDRERNVMRASQKALDMLRLMIIKNEGGINK